MPITRPDLRIRRRVAGPLAALVVLLASGCALLPGDETELPTAESADTRVQDRIEAVLRVRARAVRRGDREAWRRTVATGRGARAAEQRQRFGNLVQLPLAVFGHRVDPTTVVRSEGGWQAVVVTRMQLEGYDAVPVLRRSRFRFVADPSGPGLLVAADRDRSWERRNDVERQPWDRGRVHVLNGGSVLGVFDAGSIGRGSQILAAVQRGVEEVSGHVPYDWRGSVVVYALSDASLLSELDNLPGNPERIDALAFPVTTTDRGGRVASMRFLLHPRMLGADPGTLARLVRHEVTHVALGGRDDDVPLWLSEGIAEWVSVQPLPPAERLISGSALDAARRGPTRLPTDTMFNADGSGGDYGLAWWACEAIVDLYGEQVMWDLLTDLAAVPAIRHARLLEDRLGLTEAELAAEAASRIVATYG